MKDFLKTNIGKTTQVALYVGVSAVLNYLITAMTGDPELFGPLTGLINIVLVLVVKTLSGSTQNLGSK